jgi:hypothetical protein
VVPRIETDETSSSGDSSSSRPSHGRRRSGAAIGGSSRSGTSVGEAVAALQRTAVALGEQLHTKVRDLHVCIERIHFFFGTCIFKRVSIWYSSPVI